MRFIKLGLSMGIVAVIATGCVRSTFIPTGLNGHNFEPQSPACGAKVLLAAPKGVSFQEIGICMAQAPGGGIVSDNTPDAIFELQRCACLHGGNAIVLGGTNEAGLLGGVTGYSQQVAKARGIVIRVE